MIVQLSFEQAQAPWGGHGPPRFFLSSCCECPERKEDATFEALSPRAAQNKLGSSSGQAWVQAQLIPPGRAPKVIPTNSLQLSCGSNCDATQLDDGTLRLHIEDETSSIIPFLSSLSNAGSFPLDVLIFAKARVPDK